MVLLRVGVLSSQKAMGQMPGSAEGGLLGSDSLVEERAADSVTMMMQAGYLVPGGLVSLVQQGS
jgi:hypothetical protein